MILKIGKDAKLTTASMELFKRNFIYLTDFEVELPEFDDSYSDYSIYEIYSMQDRHIFPEYHYLLKTVNKENKNLTPVHSEFHMYLAGVKVKLYDKKQ